MTLNPQIDRSRLVRLQGARDAAFAAANQASTDANEIRKELTALRERSESIIQNGPHLPGETQKTLETIEKKRAARRVDLENAEALRVQLSEEAQEVAALYGSCAQFLGVQA